MIQGWMFLQWGGFSGSSIGDLLTQWEQLGIFSYVLPFLVIFALIFGILTKMDMFKGNKGVNAVISLAVGLMALQFEFVPRFFSEIFPRLGVGISIILVILILVGLFTPEDDDDKVFKWILFVVGLVVAIVVLISSGGAMGYGIGSWFEENWGNALLILIVVVLLIGVLISTTGGKKKKKVEVPI
jgi:hypothetical protein